MDILPALAVTLFPLMIPPLMVVSFPLERDAVFFAVMSDGVWVRVVSSICSFPFP